MATRSFSRWLWQYGRNASAFRFGNHVAGRRQRLEAAAFKGQSTKANVERIVGKSRRTRRRPITVLVLIGHGSGDGEDKIGLPVPTPRRDFSVLLANSKTEGRLINLTSASGDMPVRGSESRHHHRDKELVRAKRIWFAQFFVDALSKDVADHDKDGGISLLEAFRYAVIGTKRATRRTRVFRPSMPGSSLWERRASRSRTEKRVRPARPALLP
jgi:hypothetical protein